MHEKKVEFRMRNKNGSKQRVLILSSAFCFLCLIFAGKNSISSDNNKVRFNETRLLMGTVVEVIVIHNNEGTARRAMGSAFSEMERIDKLMSNFKEESDISRINRKAGIESVAVDNDTIEVIKKSIYYSKISNGAFDITIGRVEELYNFEDEGRIPEKDKFEKYVNHVGYKNIKINGQTVHLAKKHIKLDVGGIAKGYAIDKGIEAVRKHGITNVLINAGGDIRAIGESENGRWKVGILHPRENSKLADTLLIRDFSVATSGDYRKYFIAGGKRYHHILNPSTGLPAEGIQSVTITAPLAVDADALATAVFVMGKEKGIALIEKLKDVEGIIVDSNGMISYSSGVKKYLINSH